MLFKLCIVYPYRGFVITCAEIQQRAHIVGSAYVKGSAVPNSLYKIRVSDSGKCAFGRKRYVYFKRENAVFV